MSLRDIYILIPSHSLEDFPSDLTDEPAASVLNSFAVAWHPALLTYAESIPRWHRADIAPQGNSQQLYFVPKPAHDWLPGGWEDEARANQATVVSHSHDRAEMVRAALEFLPPDARPTNLDDDLVADFFALGHALFQMELLSRHMRQYGDVDTSIIEPRVMEAARAALANDRETCTANLRACFENLLEVRERFYPVGCFLLDLCLLNADLADDHFAKSLRSGVPLSILVSGADLQSINHSSPELFTQLVESLKSGSACIIGGEVEETPLPLLPLESVLYHFRLGRESLSSRLPSVPRTWGRRRYGLSSAMPQILDRFGYQGTLHYVLDDGLYPDEEHSRMRWQGADGTSIEALSRLPLASDAASSYMRFPQRMSESMDHDQVAGIVFAHWPDVTGPWFEDFRRINKYAPVFGEFVTFERFFQPGPSPGRLTQLKQKDYFTPFLIQAVARREKNPISRFAEHTRRRRWFDALDWCRAVANALTFQSVGDSAANDLEHQLEAAGPDCWSGSSPDDKIAAVTLLLDNAHRDWPRKLADILLPNSTTGNSPNCAPTGHLVLNPLSFSRRMAIPMPELKSPPKIEAPVHAVHFEGEKKAVVVDLPPCGFAWIPNDGHGPIPSLTKSSAVKVDESECVLQNDILQVAWNPETGGITEITKIGRRGNRLSQQLSYRFPRERTWQTGSDPENKARSQYAAMRATAAKVLSRGPTLVEVETTGDIFDQAKNETLGKFVQRIRLWAGRPVVELDIELLDLNVADGDPWNNAFVSRFAWDAETAAVTRSVQDGDHGFMGERFETTDFIEIAVGEERTTIIPMGLPFHRRSGARMVDSLLVVSGETQRKFQFTIAIDNPFPMQAARSAITPPIVVPVFTNPPKPGFTGWLFHLDSRNVILSRVLGILDAPDSSDSEESRLRGPGFALRLVETEGRGRTVRLRCFRSPIAARKRDFAGKTLAELCIEGDTVLVAMGNFEFADVELRFAEF